MSSTEPKPRELLTHSVLVDRAGVIVDVRNDGVSGRRRIALPSAPTLKGRSYFNQCSPPFRAMIKELLARERQLLSVVMPPPTLGIDAWFVVVGVPVGSSSDGGALLVHIDITSWVAPEDALDLADPRRPRELNTNLIQEAVAAAFTTQLVGTAQTEKGHSGRDYDGVESLSPRQREVLLLLGTGKSNVEIAESLSCSLNTVKRHVTAVLQKLHLPNRTKAAMLASKLNLVPTDTH
jgi:DNA-binding CsgD family transcriptional regulator